MAIPTKQALLQALSGAEGRYISGEQLAQTLGVSRAAIHKAAAALTTQGYTLEAAPAGATGCWAGTRSAPRPWASTPHRFMSTTAGQQQPTAKRLALAGAPMARWCWRASRARAGAGWAADSKARRARASIFLWCCGPRACLQGAGRHRRGRRGRGPGCAEVLRIELGIKWVNDLYYQGKKVCGILTEAATSVESGQVEWLVVGIGLNLTTTARRLAGGAGPQAGSLFPGGPVPRQPHRAGRCHRAGAAGPLRCRAPYRQGPAGCPASSRKGRNRACNLSVGNDRFIAGEQVHDGMPVRMV